MLQMQVTLEGAAVYFPAGPGALLDPAQRTLYGRGLNVLAHGPSAA